MIYVVSILKIKYKDTFKNTTIKKIIDLIYCVGVLYV